MTTTPSIVFTRHPPQLSGKSGGVSLAPSIWILFFDWLYHPVCRSSPCARLSSVNNSHHRLKTMTETTSSRTAHQPENNNHNEFSESVSLSTSESSGDASTLIRWAAICVMPPLDVTQTVRLPSVVPCQIQINNDNVAVADFELAMALTVSPHILLANDIVDVGTGVNTRRSLQEQPQHRQHQSGTAMRISHFSRPATPFQTSADAPTLRPTSATSMSGEWPEITLVHRISQSEHS